MKPWIGVDLDGTLAEYRGWVSEDHIGPPIPAMVERVLAWRKDGKEVRIFTARVAENESALPPIELWCQEHLGEVLPVTCKKDYGMVELWDDRCIQVECNTGRAVSDFAIAGGSCGRDRSAGAPDQGRCRSADR